MEMFLYEIWGSCQEQIRVCVDVVLCFRGRLENESVFHFVFPKVDLHKLFIWVVVGDHNRRFVVLS